MKLTKTQKLFLAVIIPLTAITALSSIIAIKETYANKAYEAAANEAKTDREILISKIETLNEVNSMYQTSYKTGFSNCIKTNPELTCSKKYKQIANHFSNEYDTKLLKILADQSGIALSEHFATGKITAVNNTLEYDDEIAGLVKYYSGVVGLETYYSSVANQDIHDFNKNKVEVVSIGSKFAELGLKAQNENSKELTDIKRLLDLVVAQEERNVGAGNAAPVGKAPSLMDTLTNSGQRFFDNVVLSPYNEAIISVSGCHGEELKTEFCIKYLENQNIIINQ